MSCRKSNIGFLLVFMIGLLSAKFGHADVGIVPSNPVWPRSVTGTIQAIKLNTLEIFDENDKQVKSFIYVYSTPQWHPGDYVRVDYWPHNNKIEHIQKMTVLDYHKEDQNLGYLYKADPKIK